MKSKRFLRWYFLLLAIDAAVLSVFKTWNPYATELSGTLFEITWLPATLTAFGLPAVTVFTWYTNRQERSWNYLWLILSSLIPFLILRYM